MRVSTFFLHVKGRGKCCCTQAVIKPWPHSLLNDTLMLMANRWKHKSAY